MITTKYKSESVWEIVSTTLLEVVAGIVSTAIITIVRSIIRIFYMLRHGNVSIITK